MLQVVQDAFIKFTDTFEGNLTWMYLDDAEAPGPYVTTGRGKLIDPVAEACALPWYTNRGQGPRATALQITTEWMRVKSLPSMAPQGGNAFARVTTLRLQQGDVDTITLDDMSRFWGDLVARSDFAHADMAPADAQLGLISMSWAMGPGFRFPHFQAAFLACDWATCADECKMKGVGSGPRNAAQRVLFRNAAKTTTPGVLSYPSVLWPDDVA